MMGSPENVRLVELGPGRGTLMLDALRAAKVLPEFRAAVVAHMVEVSPVLETLQRLALGAATSRSRGTSRSTRFPTGR